MILNYIIAHIRSSNQSNLIAVRCRVFSPHSGVTIALLLTASSTAGSAAAGWSRPVAAQPLLAGTFCHRVHCSWVVPPNSSMAHSTCVTLECSRSTVFHGSGNVFCLCVLHASSEPGGAVHGQAGYPTSGSLAWLGCCSCKGDPL